MANSYKYAELTDVARKKGFKRSNDILRWLDEKKDSGEEVVEIWVMQAKLALLIDDLEVEE